MIIIHEEKRYGDTVIDTFYKKYSNVESDTKKSIALLYHGNNFFCDTYNSGLQ